MDVYEYTVPLRHKSTINCRQARSPLVRLIEGEERWENPQGVPPENWVEYKSTTCVSGSGNFHSFPSGRARQQQEHTEQNELVNDKKYSEGIDHQSCIHLRALICTLDFSISLSIITSNHHHVTLSKLEPRTILTFLYLPPTAQIADSLTLSSDI
ncbi:hypothetical protein TNCV_4431171 [Trichonephila clavipes]|nr:hypothetical protein TNCV_4431171 [Trichonephila clavipes]